METLLGLLGIAEVEAALDLVERILGPGRLTARSRFFVEAVLDARGSEGDAMGRGDAGDQ